MQATALAPYAPPAYQPQPGPYAYQPNPQAYQPNPQHPFGLRYNPYRHYNPLPLAAKIGIGVAAVAAVSVGAYLLWPKEAKAGGPPGGTVPPPAPTNGGRQPGGRPSGNPPPYGFACFPPDYGGSNAYDKAYWDTGGDTAARARIFEAFEELGYQTPTNRDTMNELGPLGSGTPGSGGGLLGGGDDVPNSEVSRFQNDYNSVARWGKFLTGMGGLDVDGLVGPCTLNGMKYVLDNLGNEEWSDVVGESRGQ